MRVLEGIINSLVDGGAYGISIVHMIEHNDTLVINHHLNKINKSSLDLHFPCPHVLIGAITTSYLFGRSDFRLIIMLFIIGIYFNFR